MSYEESRKIIAKLKKQTEDNTESREKAIAALVAAGLVKQDGKPTEPYRV